VRDNNRYVDFRKVKTGEVFRFGGQHFCLGKDGRLFNVLGTPVSHRFVQSTPAEISMPAPRQLVEVVGRT